MKIEEIIEKKEIEKAIIRVIVFFDLFDYPMTDYEVWQFMDYECEYEDVKKIIGGELPSCLKRNNGLYHMAEREDIIETRMKRYNYANRKIKKTRFVLKMFKFIPWIKMIGIGNTLGSNNMKDNSDIDLFIITEQKRTWITRFFCVGITKIFRMRPTFDNQRDKICLSFYISEKDLNIRKMMLDEGSEIDKTDNYFIYWIACLIPLYNIDKTYEKFVVKNGWMKEYLPNWQMHKTHDQRMVKEIDSIVYRDIVDMMIGGVENNLKRWQYKIMPEYLARSVNVTDGVLVNDNIIKMHYNDRRRELRDRYEKRIKNLKK